MGELICLEAYRRQKDAEELMRLQRQVEDIIANLEYCPTLFYFVGDYTFPSFGIYTTALYDLPDLNTTVEGDNTNE